ncbi:ABC transporter ATP-binding protein [Planosporangium thailandense]|uniref:ABC transporter ATP-binding protein n=1 Tax=Planosporangium thailandense TaxID=765197 RepID=A0ABX0YA24_9ACTN|nr:ABC transporter ATP-binding protein [Planosporangium thailandense]NJC74255.1 ABC transporter ATP-binding protein [Planosporangium thailandense]
MTLLEVRDLTVTYRQGGRDLPAVRGVDFTLDGGEILGVAGESGSGKSTMALSLLRLLPPGAQIGGEILFEGENLRTATWGRLRAVRWAQASMVFQGAMSALNPVRTIGQQICEPILLHDKVRERAARQRAAELLDSVGIPARRLNAYPHELSGGQRQRVMIAMALACRPNLIIADEPTTALDVMVQAQILELLNELVSGTNIGVIMISHDLSVLADMCSRLAVMYAGRLVEIGPADQLFTEPRHPYTLALSRAFPTIGDPVSRLAPAGLPGDPPALGTQTSGCAFAARCSQVLPDCLTRDITLWPGGPDREAACLRVLPEYADGDGPATDVPAASSAEAQATAERPATDEQPALEVRDLKVTYPSRRGRGPARAVDGVNLTVGAGEIVALIGESGCGKSTLARALVGLVKPTSGEVRYRGTALGYSSSALKRYRRHTQLVLQDPAGALNPRQNVFDLVAEGPRLHGLTDDLTARVRDALARAGLRPPEQFFGRFPHELSGGQQQRVVIAGALALEPSVIVADEPVASLDASVRGEILRLILNLRNELGLSALIVSHDLGLAWNIADRVAVMYLGRIVEVGTVEEVLLRPKHPYTRALLSVLPDAVGDQTPVLLTGEPPEPTAIAPGCRFHPRCPVAAALPADDPKLQLCRTRELPVLSGGGHASLVACHLATEQAAASVTGA